MPLERRYSFGRFQLDLSTGHLYGPSGAIALTPKAMAVLEYFVARPNRLISKDELVEAVWPGIFVSDSALKVCISEIRRALDDDPRTPRFIETAHRRGYRFIAPVSESPIASVPPPDAGRTAHQSTSAAAPQTVDLHIPVHYARSGDVNIAYQVLGTGPIDLLFVMGWVSHLEYFWTEPTFARFLRSLASFSRLIVFDKRGTGLSDRVGHLPTLEERMDDVRAVLDAVGSRRAVLLGVSEGGPMCSLFAATYPDKTEALIMIGTYARRLRAPDYPWAPTQEERETFCREILDRWGGPVGIEARAPSLAGDPAFRDWWATYLRMGASPAAAVALTRMNAEIDVRHVLPTIRVPTLVIHRTGDRCLRVEEGRYVASLIPHARFVEPPGDDHLPFVGDQDAILDHIERFLAGTRTRAQPGQVLATILCTSLAGSPHTPNGDGARLHRLVVAEAQCFGGLVAPSFGARVFAAFDGPARAIRCARSIVDEGARHGLPLGVGLHTGECDVAADPADGLVAEIAGRIASLARPGDVLVSRTVVDLVAGSRLQFTDRGMHALGEGVKGWRVFAAQPEQPQADTDTGAVGRLLVHPSSLNRQSRR